MYGIPCGLCGWPESTHNGGVAIGEEDSPEYQVPKAGFEFPLSNPDNSLNHGYVCSDPQSHKLAADREKNPYSRR